MIAIAALIVATQVAYVAFALTYKAERPASQGWNEPRLVLIPGASEVDA